MFVPLSPVPSHVSPDSTGPGPITLLFGGDCLLAGSYEEATGDAAGYAFRDFDLLRRADVSMVNLESPVTRRGRRVPKPFNFRAHPRIVSALLEAGIDIVNLANNHIYDYGAQGLFDTILYLDSLGLQHVGAGRNSAEAYHPVIRVVNGRRVGFLGYYGGGEAPGATRNSPGVARREIMRIQEGVHLLRERDSVTYVVVNLHWGTELADHPDSDQVAFAHDVIDAGANAVIGHHPHVLQGIELYDKGVIAYSLGNLLFGGSSRSSYDTGLFEIRLHGDSTSYAFVPVRVEQWSLGLPDSAAGARLLGRMGQLSSQFPNSIFHK